MTSKTRAVAAASVFVAGAVALAGCSAKSSGGSSGQASGTPKQGGTVSVAQIKGTQPTSIFPFYTPQTNSSQNYALDYELYRPLYYYGSDDKIALDTTKSVAQSTTWGADGKSITITLKDMKWSNGEAVDGQDVAFFLNFAKANETKWALYTTPNTKIHADYIPDNITSVTASGQTVTLNLDKTYNQTWFEENELSLITPMPQAWDLTAAGTKGTCFSDAYGSAAAAKDCAADFTYLNTAATDSKTWATNPIWGVVDGPWKLKTYNSTSTNWSLVPNTSYTGSDKAHLDEIDIVTYTSETAAYAAEKVGAKAKGSVQVGILPGQDLPKYNASSIQAGNPLAKVGYYLTNPNFVDEISYYYLNDANSAVGAMFKQPYFIKALQDTVDQQGIINGVAKGWGYPTNSLIPTQPAGNEISSSMKSYTAAFSTSQAKALLTANGWDTSTTPATCTKPGTAQGECGAGVKSGQKAQFNFLYGTGSQSVLTEVQALKSDAAQAGIAINIQGQTYDAIANYLVACSSANPSGCQWQAIQYGSWIYSPAPTGDGFLATGSGNNIMSFSDPKMDQLIYNTTTQPGNAAMDAYEDYTLTAAVPLIFTPNFNNSMVSEEVATGLHVDGGSAFGDTDYEDWYWTK
jgi:peptide/nickel transport system substrate-binding protein